jgi:hypothetical protein
MREGEYALGMRYIHVQTNQTQRPRRQAEIAEEGVPTSVASAFSLRVLRENSV